jgi:hypothetical protein
LLYGEIQSQITCHLHPMGLHKAAIGMPSLPQPTIHKPINSRHELIVPNGWESSFLSRFIILAQYPEHVYEILFRY